MCRELLKRALEQPLLTNEFREEIETYLAQPEPEPVAWTTMPDSYDWDFISGSKDPNGKMQGNWQPLYTSQPDQSARVADLIAQRNTHEEIIKINDIIKTIEDLQDSVKSLDAENQTLKAELEEFKKLEGRTVLVSCADLKSMQMKIKDLEYDLEIVIDSRAELHKEFKNLKAKIEGGVRVVAKRHPSGWIGFMEYEEESPNGTLILDDGVDL